MSRSPSRHSGNGSYGWKADSARPLPVLRFFPEKTYKRPDRAGRSMSEYRLYCLGGDGKIEAAEEITASGDAEAIMIAKSMKKPVKCELWERGRMVALIDAYRAWPKKP